jgi:pilus assembly protein Flp/PilA
MKAVARFFTDERGLETVEYAIILGLIVVATIGVIISIGNWVNNQFTTVDTALSTST